MLIRLISVFSLLTALLWPQTSDIPILKPGVPVKKNIRVGEVHLHYLQAPVGSFLRGTVRQEGIAVNVKGLFPDGTKIRSFTGSKVMKNFRFVIENPGTYTLEITGLAGSAAEGAYSLSLDQVQPI